MTKAQPYPAPPWRLRGTALVRLQTLPIEAVRKWLPSSLDIVPVLPGRTLGTLYLARYIGGSTLQYHELIIAPAIVRYGAHVGGWISHIYVDSDTSIAGGRAIWALPKQKAQFQWRTDVQCEHVIVTQDAERLCSVNVAGHGQGIRAPLYAPLLNVSGEQLLHFRSTGSSRICAGHGDIDIPPSCAFASAGFGSGRQLHLRDLNVNISAPSFSPRR